MGASLCPHKRLCLSRRVLCLSANKLRKAHEAATGTTYTHIIRLRPDTLFWAPFPSHIAFDPPEKARHQLRIMDRGTCCCGNEDNFLVGGVELMDVFLDRYNSLQNPEAWEGWRNKSCLHWRDTGRPGNPSAPAPNPGAWWAGYEAEIRTEGWWPEDFAVEIVRRAGGNFLETPEIKGCILHMDTS